MTKEEFLKRFVEGYFFHDLDNMATLTVPAGKDDGAAGYPMIAITTSGIELLGGLISQSTFSNNGGNDYFLDYWNRCLAIQNPNYENLGELFRKLVRHGLVHTFLAKHGILVTKRNPTFHAPTFKIDLARQELTIDCVDFYNDFKQSYYEYIQPIIFNDQASALVSKETMQLRLDEMVSLYEAESRTSFAEYARRISKSTTSTTSTARASGASLSFESNTSSDDLVSSIPDASKTVPLTSTTYSGMDNKNHE